MSFFTQKSVMLLTQNTSGHGTGVAAGVGVGCAVVVVVSAAVVVVSAAVVVVVSAAVVVVVDVVGQTHAPLVHGHCLSEHTLSHEPQ
jgi:hypothetical protein